MESRPTSSKLDILFQRLMVVNARMQETSDVQGALFHERHELMELISRERLGQAQQIVWHPGDRSSA